MDSFTVCVLLYGDHCSLARRCLESIERTADWSLVEEVRLGLNAISPETAEIVARFVERCPVTCRTFTPPKNVGKYPLMRRMFYDVPVTTSRIMWFDDDSYVTGDKTWWRTVAAVSSQASLLGSQYRISLRGNQWRGIAEQPWFRGLPKTDKVKFCTGGWWVAETEFLRKWNYPFPELHHNGGDSLLGELCRQQNRPPVHFNSGVAINANAAGQESKAERRGLETRWPWVRHPEPEDLSHQDFDVSQAVFERARHENRRALGGLQ